MPTSWKSEEYNKHLALRVNYAHGVNILHSVLPSALILRKFVPERPIDAIPNFLSFPGSFDAN